MGSGNRLINIELVFSLEKEVQGLRLAKKLKLKIFHRILNLMREIKFYSNFKKKIINYFKLYNHKNHQRN